MLSACLTVKACEAFVLWGVVDRYSWLNGNALIPNHTDAPLIYDENYHPKPAFYALTNALNGK
jgi:endo-1,4-beta-xylanase